jgi:ubiquinone/menaquinone biosynthesis C-methylase UbiE
MCYHLCGIDSLSEEEIDMPHKSDPREKEMLLSEERQAALQPGKLLRRLGLRSGDTLADVGSGPGFFTLPAAQIVGPEGLVYAADIQGEMLTAVRSRAAQEGLTNVKLVKTSENSVPIPPESCDMVLLAFTLNELDQHASFLHRLARLIKPSGKLVILDWEKHEQPEGPPLQDRVDPEALRADATAAGLEVEKQESLNEHQYLFVLVPVSVAPRPAESSAQAV